MYKTKQVIGKHAICAVVIAMLGCQASSNYKGAYSTPRSNQELSNVAGAYTPEGITSSIIAKKLFTHYGGTLQVDSMYASQTVVGVESGKQVSVKIVRDVLDEFESDADLILREHKVTILSRRDGVTVYTGVDKSTLERWRSAYSVVPPLSVSVEILTPKDDYGVRATTTYGTQAIRSIDGNVNSKSSYGGIEVHDVVGSVSADGRQKVTINNVRENISASSSYGGIDISRIGGTVIAKARQSVWIENIQGKQVVAKSSYGGIEVHDVAGSVSADGRQKVTISKVRENVSASSSYGGIDISRIGGTVVAKARQRVWIENIQGKQVVAKSSYGGIEVRDVAGSVSADGRQKVTISKVRENVSASSSYGGIEARDVDGWVRTLIKITFPTSSWT